jgi:hypothetical protein
MKRSKIAELVVRLAATAAMIAPVGSAHAVAYNYYYGSDLVATMTTSANTTFQLDFIYAPAAPGAAFINDILLLNTGNATLGNSTFTNVGPEQGAASYNSAGFEGGPWNWRISFPTAGNAGSNRFIEGESSSWSITSTSMGDWDLSRLHINAFLNGDSVKLIGCEVGDTSCSPPSEVPEPGMLALLGLGLAGLGFARRRKA